MPIVRIEHAVANYENWKQVFDRDPADRKGSGVLRYQIHRTHDDPNFVMIDLEFGSDDQARAFLGTMERIWNGPGKAVMLNPRARVMDLVEAKDV